MNRKLERYEEAIEDYSSELKYGGEAQGAGNIKALNNRAYCFAKIAQYENAIDDYSKVI